MHKFILLLAVVAAAIAGTAQVAAADNGATTTHFTAAYFNGQGGFFTCSGQRIVKTTPKAFTKDSETCTISDITTWPAGTWTISPGGPFPPPPLVFWLSDFDGQQAIAGTIVVTDNGDGTGTMNITAYYP